MGSNSNSLRSCNIVSESLYLVMYTSEGIKITAEAVGKEVGPEWQIIENTIRM